MESGSKRVLPFILNLLAGFLVFVIFSHMRPFFEGTVDILGRFLVAGVFLSLYLVLKDRKSKKLNYRLPMAFFIATVAISLDLYLPTSRLLVKALGTDYSTPMGLALDKLDSSLIIILAVILLNMLTGGSLKDLRLQKGNLKRGLSIGIPSFAVAAVLSPYMAKLFGASGSSLSQMLEWMPWILIFIAGNAFNEELLFRGLFLSRMEPFLGRILSNLVVAVPFVLHHTGVTYTNDSLMFLLYLLPLALL
ncbi:MAG: CPBP family intramembrane metalloprotease, partial [Youngiibacter sp.]|nr:CPBP family intramembrane metalloprotease [Youngiibacter sp.]